VLLVPPPLLLSLLLLLLLLLRLLLQAHQHPVGDRWSGWQSAGRSIGGGLPTQGHTLLHCRGESLLFFS
jgi:hypothetical protein